MARVGDHASVRVSFSTWMFPVTARRRAASRGAQPVLPFAEFAGSTGLAGSDDSAETARFSEASGSAESTAKPAPPPLPAGLYLGTQGFQYDDWRGPFYPRGARPAEMLGLYARRWSAVEIDSTFYGLPRASTVERWRERTPEGFVFAAKFPRTITHEAELLGPQAADDAARFVETMALLGPKRGPLLVQLGPSFTPEKLPALDAFLAALPPGAQYAVEVRHRAWAEPASAAGLQECCARHGAAVVLLDHPRMPRVDWITTDFTYIRLLGDRKQITEFAAVQLDRSRELDGWSAMIRAFLARAVQTYVFANNHYAGHSPATLAMLRDRVVAAGLPPAALGQGL